MVKGKQEGDKALRRGPKGKEREEGVLEAAALAISELGFSNVRVADIAERANMTAGHVTYYFPSKNDLLLLALRRSEESLVADSRSEVSAFDDPVERLRWLIARAASKGFKDDGWNLWLQVWANGLSNEGVSLEPGQLDQRWFEILVEVIEYGRDRGVFRVKEVTDAAESISALIDGLSIKVTVGSDRLDRDRMLRLIEATASKLLDIR